MLTHATTCNIIEQYGELEMQALPRRSVFALRYKEKCKWCENDRTSEFHFKLFGRHSDIRVTLKIQGGNIQ